MIVTSDRVYFGSFGSETLETAIVNAALDCIDKKQDGSFEYDARVVSPDVAEVACGDHVHIKLQYFACHDLSRILKSIQIREEKRLIIFGANSISRSLAYLVKCIGYQTIVIDDRTDFCKSERFPDSYCRAVESYSKLPGIECSQADAIVIATEGHRGDRDCLEWALNSKAQYIGMFGSNRKFERLKSDWIESGAIEQIQFDRVHLPAGLDIGAEGPEEIAISIVAEIIKHRSVIN